MKAVLDKIHPNIAGSPRTSGAGLGVILFGLASAITHYQAGAPVNGDIAIILAGLGGLFAKE